MHELKFAIRQLLKNRGFTLIAVLTLALGIGANAVVFSVAKAVLFRPLGFPESDRLVWIRLRNAATGLVEERLSWREMLDIRENVTSFEAIATFGSPGALWQHDDRAEELPALGVTANLADLLGVRPALGRLFSPEDAEESAPPVVLISNELWQSRFNASPDVLGQTLRLNDALHTVVGVLPPNLQFPLERSPSLATGGVITPGVQSFWFLFKDPKGDDFTSRGARMFLPLARLKKGAFEETARAELAVLAGRLASEYPESNRNLRFETIPLRDQILGPIRHGLPLLAAAVAAVLLICCVNLANLVLARATARQRELTVKLALGASRRRLVQSVFAETFILAFLGGAAGLGLAMGTLEGIRNFASANIPFVREATVNFSVVLFAFGLSAGTALLVGLLPLRRQLQLEPVDSLRPGTRTTDDHRVRAWQQTLLIGQVAVVLVLLVGAALLLQSFRRLMAQDLGYQPESVLMVDVGIWGFETNEDVSRLYRKLCTLLSQLPGVSAVGTVSSAPLVGKWTFDERAQAIGQSLPETDRPSLAVTFVAFDFFQAMGIPLKDGSYFEQRELRDDNYGEKTILNESAAAALFPGRSAVGGRFTVGSNPNRVLEVVGVVQDTREVRLEDRPRPRLYWPYAAGGAQIIIRSSVPTVALTPLIRETIQQTDPRIIRQTIQPMSEIVSATVADRRFLMALLTAYAALALGIAVVGIGGVMAYQVAQRTKEFGIRMSLGSTRSALQRLVLGRSARMVLAGLALGLLLCLPATQFLASQLFDTSPMEPALLVAMCLLLLLASLLASLIPARRAARIDPMTALRYE